MWALITLIVVNLLGLGITLGKHGEPKGNYNFWATFITTAIEWWLLYEAGLFDKYL